MISLVIYLLVLLVVLYIVKLIVDALPLPDNIKTIAMLIVGLIFLVGVLQHLGMGLI